MNLDGPGVHKIPQESLSVFLIVMSILLDAAIEGYEKRNNSEEVLRTQL